MEILLGRGLDGLFFGSGRDDVLERLGDPDQVEQHPADGDGGGFETWLYGAAQLELRFEQDDDWRLVALSTASERASLDGTELMGLERDKLLALLEGLGEIESEGEEPEELLVIDTQGLQLWLHEAVVDSISWGCLFADEDTIAWPET